MSTTDLREACRRLDFCARVSLEHCNCFKSKFNSTECVFMLTSKSSVDAPLPRLMGLIANVTGAAFMGTGQVTRWNGELGLSWSGLGRLGGRRFGPGAAIVAVGWAA